jgi:hypothetical protein
MSESPRLESGGVTSVFNALETAPFAVVNTRGTNPWDPTQGSLTLGYEIIDPNFQIRGGRIRYCVYRLGVGAVTVAERPLRDDQLLHGRCYEVPLGERWDGTIEQGLTDRVGEVVDAELSHIWVYVEAWNTPNPAPAGPEDPMQTAGAEGRYRTVRDREWVAWSRDLIAIDCIVQGSWARNWITPYPNLEEPDKAEVGMNVRVKNVREGTPARFWVTRIKPDFSIEHYCFSNDEDQELAHGAVVRGGRVLLPNGQVPKIRFTQIDLHWTRPGENNFYCFWVGFGTEGACVLATPIDYMNQERECLHLRFTVAIVVGQSDLPEYNAAGQNLHNFFRGGTKYYRSYLKTSMSDAEAFAKFTRGRYIVILLTHAACGCNHDDHPTYVDHGETKKMDPYHGGFVPDRNVCPTELVDTPEARRGIAEDRRHYHHDFGGCGNRERVFHQNKAHRAWITHFENDTGAWIQFTSGSGTTGQNFVVEAYRARRFLWNGGCRTALTTNFGNTFSRSGTSYYHGWIYSPSCDYGVMCTEFFRDWIKGGPIEYDDTRIVEAYLRAARRGTRPRHHPRLIQGSNYLNPMPDPAAARGALE